TGQGIATGALSELIRLAFTELNLHRLQGETLVDNRASQHVLARCGFIHYGTAPSYLRIQGRWQTHELYQLTNDHWRE
uniref:GNAT family N-acetyltransferase n=1 Tax=Arthrobacter sp. GMC3 TaxID=2058894 RepID=UPI0011AFF0BF